MDRDLRTPLRCECAERLLSRALRRSPGRRACEHEASRQLFSKDTAGRSQIVVPPSKLMQQIGRSRTFLASTANHFESRWRKVACSVAGLPSHLHKGVE